MKWEMRDKHLNAVNRYTSWSLSFKCLEFFGCTLLFLHVLFPRPYPWVSRPLMLSLSPADHWTDWLRASVPAAVQIVTGTFHSVLCHHSASFMRKYIKHVFVDLKTFSPLCFAVALNFQSLGMAMDLNDGRFQDNGGCGYILKPEVLMSSKSFDPGWSHHNIQPMHLLLKVEKWIKGSRVVLWVKGKVTGLCTPKVCYIIRILHQRRAMCSWPPDGCFSLILWTYNDVKLHNSDSS